MDVKFMTYILSSKARRPVFSCKGRMKRGGVQSTMLNELNNTDVTDDEKATT